MSGKTLTFVMMDPPFESSRTASTMRLVDLAIEKGHNVNVFGYEGAVALSYVKQEKHANKVHGREVAEEDHPLPREWIAGMMAKATRKGVKFDWINCGLCADERGMSEVLEGTRRGSPADLWNWAGVSSSTLVVASKA